MPSIRVELDRHRVDGRATFFRHVGQGLFERLSQAHKINDRQVVLPETAFRETAKAYYLLSDTYKVLAGIEWTDDIKKAALSMAAVIVVSPFQVPEGASISNRYVPHINGLLAEAVACSILGNDEFVDRHFESKLHFYSSLRLLGKFDGLSTFAADLRHQTVQDIYEIELSVQDRYKISQAIQTSEMIYRFRVFARLPGEPRQSQLRGTAIPPKQPGSP